MLQKKLSQHVQTKETKNADIIKINTTYNKHQNENV